MLLKIGEFVARNMQSALKRSIKGSIKGICCILLVACIDILCLVGYCKIGESSFLSDVFNPFMYVKFPRVCSHVPIAAAARTEAWVWDISLAGIAGSSPAGDMDVCPL